MRHPYEDVIADRIQRFTREKLPERGWREKSACRDYPTELFYMGEATRGENKTINAMCITCPVRRECLLDEFQSVRQATDLHGFRAGLNLEKRAKAFRQWRKELKEKAATGGNK